MDPKRTQRPAQATIPSKTLNIDEETKIFRGKKKITQYLSTNPALQRWKTPTQGGKLHYRKSKKVIFQQSQWKIITQT